MSGSPGPQFVDTLDPRFQRPLSDQFSGQIAQGLQNPLPAFPGAGNVPDVMDPAVTQQYFQNVFVDPTMQQLTGPHGTISRIGAGAAGRGVFFSSGREQQQADAAIGAFGGLAQSYAGLIGGDQDLAQQEWMRRQPFAQQRTQQMLNWLGTPMTVGYEDQPSPWGAVAGAGLGAGLGALFAAPTGGLSMGMGAYIGAQAGSGIGGAIYS